MEPETPAAVKSVSIIAMGHSRERYLHDFDRNNYSRPTNEAWGVNSVMYWFGPELLTHGIAMDNFERDMEMDGGIHKAYVEKMLGCGLPIMADVEYPQWPQVQAYPIDDVVDDIWSGPELPLPDLENTINFAIALAIHRKFDELRLYGCDFRLRDDTSALMQVHGALEKIKPWWFIYHNSDIVKFRRDLEPGEPTTMFLLGVAHARGIKIHIAEGSSLCGNDRGRYAYGYQKQPVIWDTAHD